MVVKKNKMVVKKKKMVVKKKKTTKKAIEKILKMKVNMAGTIEMIEVVVDLTETETRMKKIIPNCF